MVCRYTFDGPDGQALTLIGKPAIKAYLASGGLAHLLPKRDMPAFKRSPVQAATSPDVQAAIQRVEQVVANQTEGWANSPRVIVVADMNDARIPQAIREDEKRQQAQALARGEPIGDVRGFYNEDNLYLIAPQLPTDMDAARVLFHEGLGHLGLRGLFGEGLNAVLGQIVALRKSEVIAKAKAYGLDVTKEEDMLHAAEEVLASMAETTPTIGFVKRAIAAIRAWLRQNVPGFSNLQMSDAEVIERFILPARAFVEQGAKTGRDMAAAAAFSRSQSSRKIFTDDVLAIAKAETRKASGGSIYAMEEDVQGVIPGKPRALDRGLARGDFTEAEIQEQFAGTIAALRKANGDDLILWRADAPDDRKNSASKTVYMADEDVASQYAVNGRAAKPYRVKIDDVLAVYAKPSGYYEAIIRLPSGGLEIASDQSPRFSRAAAPAPTGLTLPEQGLLRRVQAAMQDNMNRVRQVQERITEITGQPIPERSNYYGAETNRPGRIAARLDDAKNKMTGPLMAKLAKSGHTAAELGELLHAMHAQERNEAIARINKDMPDGGSGMLTADANAILRKYATNKTLHALADQARDIAKATLELKLAYGMIDGETVEALTAAYKNYVPLKGDGEFGPKVKRAMGHDEREEHILENLARDYDQAVVTGEKNLARQSLLSMVLENPDAEFWTVGMPPKGRYVAGQSFDVYKGSEVVASFTTGVQAQAWVDGRTDINSVYTIEIERGKFSVEKNGKVIAYLDSHSKAEKYISNVKDEVGKFTITDSGETVREFVKPLQDNEVMVYIDGQPVRIQIKDEQLARQLRPLDQGQMNPVLEFMRSMNRYLSKIYTGYNPAFIIRNTARDAMTGTINMIGNEGAGTAAKAWSRYPAALKALSSYAVTGKEPTGETGKYLYEYRQHGGKTGASWMSDLEQQGKTLQTMFDDAYGASGYLRDGKPGKAAAIAGRKIVGGLAHVIEVANQATENGLRLALFIAMREQGKTAGEAAQAAKSVTVDFDRKGSMTGAMGAIYLFFNPAVQGTANAIKTLVKGGKKEQAWMALGALAMLGVYAASQGMDDDKDRWLGEGWETRSKNFMLNIGGHTIKVPVSMEFAPFYAFGIAMSEAKRGESKMAAAGHIVSSFLDAYFPLNGAFSSESDNHGLDAVGAAMPTILKPGFQIAANRNVFGSPVVPDNEFTKDRPDNLKMFRGTKGTTYDVAAQGIAKAGEALGSGRYENDITKVSPETLKMLWRTYTGGLGQFVSDAAGLANVAASDPKNLETGDIPIVKDFVKTNDVKAIRGRFYELSKDARAASEEFRQAKKAGDGEGIDAILDRPEKADLLGLDKMIKNTTKAAAGLRDEMVDINQDKNLSLAQKRERLKDLELEEEAIYRDAIGAFK